MLQPLGVFTKQTKLRYNSTFRVYVPHIPLRTLLRLVAKLKNMYAIYAYTYWHFYMCYSMFSGRAALHGLIFNLAVCDMHRINCAIIIISYYDRWLHVKRTHCL